MKRLFLIGVSISLVLATLMLASPVAVQSPRVPDFQSKILALPIGAQPVAMITPLPDEVSNGTWWNLNASGSNDPDGIIANYTWSITIGSGTSYLYGRMESFKFRTLGLYKIVLTVGDNDNNTASAFTAVYSIIDSDSDGLPDWWEVRYFYSLGESGSDDHDHDGYTNLQEYASHTDPTVKDPQPGVVQSLKENWMYLLAVAAIIVVALLALMPKLKQKRKENEKKKIEFAIEIEKALQGEK